MKKAMKRNLGLPLLILSCCGAMTLASCNGNNPMAVGDSIYTITFNPCTGSDADLIRVTAKAGDDVAFPKKNPTRGTSQFLGWSTGYNKSKRMGDPNKVVTSLKANGNTVLYAAFGASSAHTQEEVDQYMEGLKSTSEENHFYYHYYRFENTPASYAGWDVWAWIPEVTEGAKFDWVGRTQSSDHKTATGDATVDSFGGAYVDIDLEKTYDGGWNAKDLIIGGSDVCFAGTTQLGLQIVDTKTRDEVGGFWVNDGSNLTVNLADYEFDLGGGKKCYHVFVVQDAVQSTVSGRPAVDISDPFENDDGTNVTYGNPDYDNIKWNTDPGKTKTDGAFLGDNNGGVGVGYQIMVSSFADSDGDGFGDIYGIEKRLDYLADLGVKALWLTPIQLSDSYHGYDITDYSLVDPKFGSSVSPAALKNNGVITSDTALADYRSLITAAHEKGMKIVMDLVLNHTSTSNNWFVASANLDDEYRGYYQWGNNETQAKIKPENFWYRYGDHPYSFYAKFGSSMPELNFSYQQTRDAVIDTSAYWVKDVGVDGFRLDAVKHIYMLDEVSSYAGDTVIYDNTTVNGREVSYSSDLTKNLHFFKELKKKVTEKAGREVFFVGENFDGTAYSVAPYYEAFDSMFDFYSYYNLTSAAATGRLNRTSGFGTAQGFMANNSTYKIDPEVANDAGNILAREVGKEWNFPAVYQTYNAYRGDTSLPGCFTSNHDIARTINRIAGTGTPQGLQAQGNVTVSNYAEFDKSANCVKIAELMFPGTTWVYYGDEIGMTGNFPEKDAYGDPYTAQSAYSDLWYRQPMKWVASPEKNDGHYSTDYYVTGSGQKVGFDEVNASSAVVPAEAQWEEYKTSGANGTGDFSVMASFIKIKNATPALIRGSFQAENYVGGTDLAANVLGFSRTYNGTTIKVCVNFNGVAMGENGSNVYGLDGTVLASYNGATKSYLPPYSAIVVKA